LNNNLLTKHRPKFRCALRGPRRNYCSAIRSTGKGQALESWAQNIGATVSTNLENELSLSPWSFLISHHTTTDSDSGRFSRLYILSVVGVD
jgi:hypothetical protein